MLKLFNMQLVLAEFLYKLYLLISMIEVRQVYNFLLLFLCIFLIMFWNQDCSGLTTDFAEIIFCNNLLREELTVP